MRRIILALFIAALGPLLIEAQENASQGCSELLDRAFEVAGVNDFIASIPAQVERQIASQAQSKSSLSDADKQKVAAALTRALDPNKIGSAMRQGMVKSCDVEALRAVVGGLTA